MEFITTTSTSTLEQFSGHGITGPDNFTPPEFLSSIDSRYLCGPLMRVKLTRLRGGGCVLGAGRPGYTGRPGLACVHALYISASGV